MPTKNNRRSSNTAVTSLRVTKRQLACLRMLPPSISASVLVRTLLDEYFSGKLPNIHALVLKEAARTEIAMKRTQF